VNAELQQLKAHPSRAMGIVLAFIGLVLSYMLQDVDTLALLNIRADPAIHFAVRKLIRVMINDTCLLLIIHFWFSEVLITRLAWKVQLIDTLILLPLYLVIKLKLEGPSEISSPLLSQLHRMIVNPTLMILIIPGVYFQRTRS